jgi:cell division protease FtsH
MTSLSRHAILNPINRLIGPAQQARSCRLSFLLRFAIAVTAILLAVPAAAQALSEGPGGRDALRPVPDPVAVSASAAEISYPDFLEDVNAGRVASVVMSGQAVRGDFTSGKAFTTVVPQAADDLTMQALVRNHVEISVERPDGMSPWAMDALIFALLLLLGGVAVSYSSTQKRKDAAGTAARSFCNSRARRLGANEVKTTFSDVAGIEESKQELVEIVEFLKEPGKFQQLGGRIPKGVLLSGSPGTGKTLLARAIAGEAGVPFFSISGSDFVEMYVGVGAARVRDLFQQAKLQAPCIVFIDEIDAVGRHRAAGGGGGHEEREQTLNQLLAEMDGFEGDKGIIVIAATNRPDVLDSALLRPGRFDRQVVVPLPDVRGREQILRVHLRRVPLADDAHPALIARGTPGFSGADLANLVNEAALFAAHAGKRAVGSAELERAREKILMGPERRSLFQSEQERRLTAYHEAGHAIVGLEVPDHDPVYKISIIPHGRALGVTAYLPEADRSNHTRESLNSRICALLGGRVAEELIFGAEHITTGAANDIHCATDIARRMVIQYGMSDHLGPLDYSAGGDPEFLQIAESRSKAVSEDTARAIDREVREIVEQNYLRARRILETDRDGLHRLAEALLREETIEGGQIKAIIAGSSRELRHAASRAAAYPPISATSRPTP